MTTLNMKSLICGFAAIGLTSLQLTAAQNTMVTLYIPGADRQPLAASIVGNVSNPRRQFCGRSVRCFADHAQFCRNRMPPLPLTPSTACGERIATTAVWDRESRLRSDLGLRDITWSLRTRCTSALFSPIPRGLLCHEHPWISYLTRVDIDTFL
jgi:hypothetical protein